MVHTITETMKRQGKYMANQLSQVRALYLEGYSTRGVGKELGIPSATVSRFVHAMGISRSQQEAISLLQRQGKFYSVSEWSCAHRGDKSPNWKGGKHKDRLGYVLIKLLPDDFFYAMADKNGYVLEHRLAVARALGRNLHRWEIVHHKGAKYPKGSREDKGDNRYPENLQLVTDDRHKQISILERRINRLEGLLKRNNIAF